MTQSITNTDGVELSDGCRYFASIMGGTQWQLYRLDPERMVMIGSIYAQWNEKRLVAAAEKYIGEYYQEDCGS